MNASRKRQKTSSACQRCRQRKLGCDRERPCQLCVRAGVECIARHAHGSGPDGVAPTYEAVRPVSGPLTSSTAGESPHQSAVEPAVLPESSIVDLTTLIFSRMSLDPEIRQDTSALPGGHKVTSAATWSRRHWRQVVDMELPDETTLISLVNEFILSVDWFMMVLHEPSFRDRYAALLRSEHVLYHEENFLWLAMLVVALGAHYATVSPSAVIASEVDLRQLSSDLIARVEARFLQLVGCATLEAVQICVLLSSFLLFNGRPNVGLAVSGAGVKIAQVINLHRENRWRDTSAAVMETKRRTWWALEVLDKYTAVAFGRPCVINDSDCSVGMVSDPDATVGNTVGDNVGSATSSLLLYHQWKFRLYRTMGDFIGRRSRAAQTTSVRAIHEQLAQWKEELPAQLRIETYDDPPPEQEPSLPQLQALALQLAYDNLQIVLHRAVAIGDGNKLQVGPEGLFSLRHLTEAAMRTAGLHKFPNTLRACRCTHANMHVGITLFTAGVVLCVVCLLQPLSSTSQRAKTGVMHIIRVCQDASTSQHIVSKQSLTILERLVTVILQLENQIITGKSGQSMVVNSSDLLEPDVYASDFGKGEPRLVVDSSTQNFLQQAIAEQAQEPGPAVSHEDESETAHIAAPLDQTTSGYLGSFDWDGSLSALADSGLGDASQLWLWTQNADAGPSPPPR